MKLLDEKGSFQFIKNEQVVIDKSLIKWKELQQLIEAASKKDAKAVPSNDANQLNFIADSTSKKAKALDELCEAILTDMDSAKLIPFAKSEHAKEFNEKFQAILSGELDLNKYSVNVPVSNWQIYDYDVSVAEIASKKSATIKGLWEVINKYFNQVKEEKNAYKAGLHVVDFFSSIHILSTKERDFSIKLEGILKLINNAGKMRQSAQLSQLCNAAIINIYEAILATHGFDKYILFSELSKIKSPGKKVIDIDYIANYNRVIPDDIIDKKCLCDLLRVFDNYCVMYYDPTGQTYRAPEAARRDPILFGLINHSPKLYYIGDWVDEKCDLTLEQIASRLSVQTIK